MGQHRTCPTCGASFYASQGSPQRYCSQACGHEANRQRFHQRRNCWDYREWRKHVFSRDGYTCQDCGARGCKLNAHHVKPWQNYPALRFDLDNGITLCEACHTAVHARP